MTKPFDRFFPKHMIYTGNGAPSLGAKRKEHMMQNAKPEGLGRREAPNRGAKRQLNGEAKRTQCTSPLYYNSRVLLGWLVGWLVVMATF